MTSLTARQLFAEAGDLVFARGEDYVRYVRGLRVTGERAVASIQAKNVYAVELDWSRRRVDGSCTCPHHADGNFCKHLVAVGLAAIDAGYGETSGSATEPATAADDLVAMVRDALSVRGFVDYRRSFEVASDAEAVLDELEGHLDAGAADAARPALLRAVTRLRKITEQADDSSGSIGGACQRAADLYARSCREGQPDRVKLAKWLLKFRDESPGWPETTLADFVEAFDDRALATYRRGVAALDSKYQDLDEWKRFEVNRMLLELADHDGDVDRTVELLSRGEHPEYAGIVARLQEAGRADEAVAWIDRAVAAGKVTGHMGGHSYWLSPTDVAATYRDLGRVDDAIDVLRAEFARQAGVATYRLLIEFAEREGRADREREWALACGRELASERFGSGAALIEIALSEGDLDAAWAAAKEYGAGYSWEKLAKASSASRPIDAAELYRPLVEKDLTHPNTKLYPKITDMLATMRDLYRRGGAEETFASYVAQLRDTYQRRTSLMAALDRKQL